MAQKNPFLKYMMKDKREDVFHSSAYAKAQNGASIGAASTESYQVRVNINQNRSRVRGYNDSRVVTGAKMNAPKAKTYTPPEKTVDNTIKKTEGMISRHSKDGENARATASGARISKDARTTASGARVSVEARATASKAKVGAKPPVAPRRLGISVKR